MLSFSLRKHSRQGVEAKLTFTGVFKKRCSHMKLNCLPGSPSPSPSPRLFPPSFAYGGRAQVVCTVCAEFEFRRKREGGAGLIKRWRGRCLVKRKSIPMFPKCRFSSGHFRDESKGSETKERFRNSKIWEDGWLGWNWFVDKNVRIVITVPSRLHIFIKTLEGVQKRRKRWKSYFPFPPKTSTGWKFCWGSKV